MGVGWVLGGYWVHVGCMLGGCWVVVGWMLGGFWMISISIRKKPTTVISNKLLLKFSFLHFVEEKV